MEAQEGGREAGSESLAARGFYPGVSSTRLSQSSNLRSPKQRWVLTWEAAEPVLAETSWEEEEVGSLWNKFCICDENTTQPSMAPNCWDKTHMHLFAFCFVSWTCQRIESVSISVLWMEPHCGGSPWGLFRLFPRPNEVDCRCDKPLNPLLIVTLRRRSSSGWGSWPFRTLKSTKNNTCLFHCHRIKMMFKF